MIIVTSAQVVRGPYRGSRTARRTVGGIAGALLAALTLLGAHPASAETIGEMQSGSVEIIPQEMSAIPIAEVARRYQKLLDEAADLDVRIDALHRLINLRSIAGDEMDISQEQEPEFYRGALELYETAIASEDHSVPIDELLYQNARAFALVGDRANSMERLEQLVALHPGSEHSLESRFRIAGYAFDQDNYEKAERLYRDVISTDPEGPYAVTAEYMLGWSQFKLDQHSRAAERFLAILDRYTNREDGLERLGPSEAELVDDSFRALSIIAAYEGGARVFEALLADRSRPPYEVLLYERLADYYLAKERYADSAAASEAFVARYLSDPAAPVLARRVVEAYERGNFADQAMAARERYIERFGSDERFKQLNPDEQETLRHYLDRAGRHYYRRGQDTSEGTLSLSGSPDGSVEGPSVGAESREHYRQAAEYLERWTQLLDNGYRGEQLVLAADAWVRAGEPDNALPLYEIAGYREGMYQRPADAGYAAVMIYRRRLREAGANAETDADEAALEDALAELVSASERYMRIHVEDPRASAVRAHIANLLYERGREEQAEALAVSLTHDKSVTGEQRRAGMLVMANVAYNQEHFAAAERYYRQALDGMSQGTKLRSDTEDKLAASIYRQGEVAAAAGQADSAVDHFLRVADVSTDASVIMRARFDAANTLFNARRWQDAIASLTDFRSRYPGASLSETADDKLVHAYEASGDYGKAADTLLAQVDRRRLPPEQAWESRIAAAEWYERAARDASARAVYRDYLASGTRAFGSHDYQQELRWKLAEHARAEGDSAAANVRYQQILAAENGDNGSDRSRYLAAQSALVLASRADSAFRSIRLTNPLQETLRRKQAALETAIGLYERAQQFAIMEVTSQSTYAIAELYLVLAQHLIESEPPAGLTDLQRQQYLMLLEEQAYPFEEKAIALHEQNHAMLEDRHWNSWINDSLSALAEIVPARYAREPRWMQWSSEEVAE